MSETIQDNKFVELAFKVVDQKTGQILSEVEFPLSYVHGHNDVLLPAILTELVGKSAGDIIDVPIDCSKIYGPRDESLVFTDHIDNVPKEFHEIGATIVTQNEKGESKNFIVTRMNDKSLTVDGNNPLCGREAIFTLEILTVREPTDEEFEAGGAIIAPPDIKGARKVPV